MREMKRIFSSSEGMILTFIFTLMFIVTNLIMVDVGGVQDLMTGHNQTPFFILILLVILAYLFKNSRVEINPSKAIFLVIWTLYVLSIFVSMFANRDFVWAETIVLVMLTVMFFFKLPRGLLIIMTVSALISLPALFFQPILLNESGATLVLIYTAGLIFLPKTNMAMLYYGLPALALLLVTTHSRTAIAVFILVTVIQLTFINVHRRDKRHRRRFLIGLAAVTLLPLLVFFRPLLSHFTRDGLGMDGADWNRITNGRYDPWMTILDNVTWLGEGRGYIDFTSLLHAHNIFFDTLGRYGIITTVLFTALIISVLVISLMSVRTFNVGLYILTFVLIGMTEYNYLFMFIYFSPVILFFVIVSHLLDMHGEKERLAYEIESWNKSTHAS